jgi:energy-coupling factor transport system ATP-binding protein
MHQRVAAVLEQLGISGLRHRSIHGLSAGQRQRVAIGSALTLQPRVLVLDEPTSQLDPEAAEDVLSSLQRLSRDLGLTIVLSEHRLERVAPYADRVIYVPGAGQPPVCGTPRDVLAQMPFAPPVVQLAQALGWRPVPLTVEEAREFARQVELHPPDAVDGREAGKANGACIEAQGVWYDYDGVEALKGLELEVAEGELVALTGRNGSGKTTLLKHFVGLLRPRQGQVIVHGMDTQLARVEDLIEHVGYVPQNPSSLLFADTVRQELAFTRRAHHLPPADPDRWLELLGLDGLGERYPRDLSVGERQRVALAAILVAEPVTLLLDEPTRGLDPLEKASLAGFLKAQASRGYAVVVATHDVELAAQCAQRMIVLDEGRVVMDAPVGEVMTQRPIYSPQVNRLYGDPRILTVQDALEAQADEN